MSARRWWRVTTTALVVAAASIGLTGTALAHPVLLGSRPAAGAELVATPSQLSVTFSEPVDVSGDGLVVRGPQGLVELAGDADEVDGDRTVVARPAEALPAGSYTFGWTVTASDGDVLTGTVPFTVSAAAAATSARPPPYTPVGSDEAAGGSTAGAATGAALRWLLFLGLSLALGGVVGARLVAGVPGFGAPQPPLAFGGGLVAVAATGSALHTLGAGDPAGDHGVRPHPAGQADPGRRGGGPCARRSRGGQEIGGGEIPELGAARPGRSRRAGRGAGRDGAADLAVAATTRRTTGAADRRPAGTLSEPRLDFPRTRAKRCTLLHRCTDHPRSALSWS